MIELTYGGTFDEGDLAQHIRKSGRNFIIQGQTECSQSNHPKRSSLDFWLRSFATNPDTKQADNQVLAALVETRLFQESGNLVCPDSCRVCKGLVLADEDEFDTKRGELMGEIINFPGYGEDVIKRALQNLRGTYIKAGLSDDEISVAMVELEPIVRELLVRKEFELNLSGSFTPNQIELIKEAHNKTMQDAISQYKKDIGMALCYIAGLIGRSAKST